MTLDPLDSSTFLPLVRQQDEDAAQALFQHLNPFVLRLIRSHRPRRESEEDMAQEVFMRIFTHLDQYSGTVPLKHWVSRIAINTCLNQIAREKVRPECRYADLSEEEEYTVTSLQDHEKSELPSEVLARDELVEKLMESLSQEDQLVIRMIHLENRSIEDVRTITGWSLSLVKVRAFRAREKMRRHLSKLVGKES